MPNYKLAKIYKIFSESHPEIVYYGSTCSSLSKRMVMHRFEYNSKKEHATSSILVSKYGDAKIVLVELCPCNSKEELYKRERFYIENNKCVNKQIPGLTRQEVDKKYNNTHKQQRHDAKVKRVWCHICGLKISQHSLKRHIDRQHKDGI